MAQSRKCQKVPTVSMTRRLWPPLIIWLVAAMAVPILYHAGAWYTNIDNLEWIEYRTGGLIHYYFVLGWSAPLPCRRSAMPGRAWSLTSIWASYSRAV